MEFKSISIVKHPTETVWANMRDHFPQIGELIDDLEYIKVQSVTPQANDILEVVNHWKAAPKIPDFITQYIKPEMMSWTDIARWNEQEQICQWRIESHYFREQMDCTGSTRFEPALGGRGCRLTFAGRIEWEGSPFRSLGIMDGMISKTIESVMGKMIPNSFRKVTQGVEKYLAQQ